MPASFVAVDLSRLPVPAIVEPLSFEAIYADALAAFRALDPAYDAVVESDPAVKLLEVFAYRELALRQRINDASRACMVATAAGADLDNLAAIFGVERLVIQEANPALGIPELREGDDALRQRIILATESYTVAGPAGAYKYHALSADPRVLDASVASPSPGQVVVTVLARAGDGTPPPDLIAAVQAHLSADDVRPLTDLVTVAPAAIVPFAVTARLTVFNGPDSGVVLAAAQARLAAYLADVRRLGRDVARSGLFGALHVEGVHRVELLAPPADLILGDGSAGHCTGIDVAVTGVGA